MNKLKKTLRSFYRLGYRPVVKRAPKDAVTFDRLIVVFNKNDIYRVLLYNSRDGEVVGQK